MNMRRVVLMLLAIATLTATVPAQTGFTHIKHAGSKPLPATGTYKACFEDQLPGFPPVAGKQSYYIGVTALATFDCTDEGPQTTPTGTLTLYYDEQAVATLALDNGVADFTLSTAGISAGTYTITLAYSGDAVYLPQSLPISITLVAAETTATSVTSNSTWVVGDKVSLDGYVATGGYTDPINGTITFTSKGYVLASIPLNNMPTNFGVQASLSSAGVPPGTYNVVANYSGDSLHAPSTSTPLAITLLANSATTTTLTVSPIEPEVGDTVTLTAQVARSVNDEPYTGVEGYVQFVANDTVIGTLPLNADYDPSQAVLTASTAGLKPGTYDVVAKFLGTAADSASSSAQQPVTVTFIPSTTITFIISPNPVTRPATIYLTATVSENNGSAVPTGTVTFSYNGNSIASGTLNNGTVQVPLATVSLSAGIYTITADYSGDANDGASESTTTLTVQ